jgi:hypothetical protein
LKNFFLLIFFALLLFITGGQTAKAQEEKRLDSAPRAFQTFFAEFRTAIEKSDKTAIVRMTRFPFRYGFDAGDEGAMTRAQFVKRFTEIFGKSPKQFLPEKNPLFSKGGDGSYTVSTEDAAHLSFVKSGSGFKFAAYIVEP